MDKLTFTIIKYEHVDNKHFPRQRNILYQLIFKTNSQNNEIYKLHSPNC